MWITPGDILDSKYIDDTERKLSKIGFEQSRSAPKNSVFVTCIGIIGKICINRKECSCNQQINIIIPFDDYDSDYIYYIISKNSPKFKLLAGRSVTPILNKSDFEMLKLSFPFKSEQKKISRYVSLFDFKIELIEDAVQRRVVKL